MPWQGHLWIGQKIQGNASGVAVLTALGAKPSSKEYAGDPFEYKPLKKRIKALGRTFTVEISAARCDEGGGEWPVDPTSAAEGYTDALVGFPLTQRYAGAVLDHMHKEGGRPEPFEFDPRDISEILKQVQAWWPEARAMIWTEWH